MKIHDTSLTGVKYIESAPIFGDHRGVYQEIYNKKLYDTLGVEFVQDDFSLSHNNVLRGIHGDAGTWKLISCIYGAFYLVVLNCNKDSKEFGQWEGFILNDRKPVQILVPPKFGNGHLVISNQAIFHYKQSTYYGDYKQFTVSWDTPSLNMHWPTKNPILSDRDKNGPFDFWSKNDQTV